MELEERIAKHQEAVGTQDTLLSARVVLGFCSPFLLNLKSVLPESQLVKPLQGPGLGLCSPDILTAKQRSDFLGAVERMRQAHIPGPGYDTERID